MNCIFHMCGCLCHNHIEWIGALVECPSLGSDLHMISWCEFPIEQLDGMPCLFLTFLSSQSYTMAKRTQSVFLMGEIQDGRTDRTCFVTQRHLVTTWMHQLTLKTSSVKEISWNTRGMIQQLNIITFMVTLNHFKSNGRNQ